MKSYKSIKSITLADKHNVYEVIYHDLPTLSNVSYDDGSIEKNDLLLTKDAVLEDAEFRDVSVCNSFRSFWQLSDNLKRQVKATMIKKEVV